MISSNNREISVLLTPPEPWTPERTEHVRGTNPDPFAIYQAMESEGVHVKLLDPNTKPWNPLHGRHPLYMGLDPWRALTVLSSQRKVDLVLSVFESSCLIPLLLRRPFGFRPKIAMWDIVPTQIWKSRKLMQDIVVPRIDHIFLLSAGQRPILENRWGASAKTTVVHQHIDAEFFAPQERQTDGSVLAIGDDIGRDYETLMEAISELEITLKAKTKKQLSLPNNQAAKVEQIPKRLSFVELKDLYAGSDFVVIPLHVTENVSGVGSVLEAMSMGKALIVSDNPVIRDYVIKDETALVVKPNDPRDLRDAIASLQSNPDLVRKLGQNGRAFIERQFANPVFGRRMANSIRQILA